MRRAAIFLALLVACTRASTPAPTLQTIQGPVVDALAAAPPVIAPGGTATLLAHGFSPSNKPLTFTWSVNGTGWFVSGSGATGTLTAPMQFSSTVIVTATATDSSGATGAKSVVVSTAADVGPVIESLAAVPSTVEPGAMATLLADIAAPTTSTLTYAWKSSDSAWVIAGEGAVVTITPPDRFGATDAVTLTVTDGTGASASSSVIVSTTLDSGPQIQGLFANPPVIAPGGSSTLTARASNLSGVPPAFEWTSSDPTWLLSGSGDTVTIAAPEQFSVMTVVTMSATDSTGATSAGSIIVSTEMAIPPTIAELFASPTVVAPGGTSTLIAQALTNDTGIAPINYAWTDSDPTWSLSGSGSIVTITAPEQFGAMTIVTMTATDGTGTSTSGNVFVSTAMDTPPTIDELFASPPIVEPGGTSTLIAQALTNDNISPLNYVWTDSDPTWSFSGTGAVVTIKAPDEYSLRNTVTATVTDSAGLQTSKTVFVGTTADPGPDIQALVADPSVVMPGGTATLTGQLSAPDVPVTYAWTDSDPTWSFSGSGNVVTLTAPDVFSSQGIVTLTATDSLGMRSARSVTVQTINSP